MAASLFLPFSIANANGAPISGAKLYFYAEGTTTPLAIYQDEALTTPHTNPVIADANGRFAPIYLQALAYKIVLKDADDVTLQTHDNFNPDGGTVSITDLPDNTTRIVDNADGTKKLAFEVSGVTTGTTRTLTVPDENGTIATQAYVATQIDTISVDDLAALQSVSTTGFDAVLVLDENFFGIFDRVAGDQSALVTPSAWRKAASGTPSSNIVTVTGHGWKDGDAVIASSTDLGLALNTVYYVNAQTADTVSLHTTHAAAIADTSRVTLSGSVSSLTLKKLADPAQAIYVIATGDGLDGTDGIWQRRIPVGGTIFAAWFGVDKDASGAVNASSMHRALTFQAILSVGSSYKHPIVTPPGVLEFASPIVMDCGNASLFPPTPRGTTLVRAYKASSNTEEFISIRAQAMLGDFNVATMPQFTSAEKTALKVSAISNAQAAVGTIADNTGGLVAVNDRVYLFGFSASANGYIALQYSGAVGTAPVNGQTVTSSGGATGTIIDIGASTGTEGDLTVDVTSGTFAVGETITTATLGTGTPGNVDKVITTPLANGQWYEVASVSGNTAPADITLRVDDGYSAVEPRGDLLGSITTTNAYLYPERGMGYAVACVSTGASRGNFSTIGGPGFLNITSTNDDKMATAAAAGDDLSVKAGLWRRGFVLDGELTTSGAQGIRDVTARAYAFYCTEAAIYLSSVVNGDIVCAGFGNGISTTATPTEWLSSVYITGDSSGTGNGTEASDIKIVNANYGVKIEQMSACFIDVVTASGSDDTAGDGEIEIGNYTSNLTLRTAGVSSTGIKISGASVSCDISGGDLGPLTIAGAGVVNMNGKSIGAVSVNTNFTGKLNMNAPTIGAITLNNTAGGDIVATGMDALPTLTRNFSTTNVTLVAANGIRVSDDAKVILDDDGDTYITSDTDDQIQMFVGGTQVMEIAAGNGQTAAVGIGQPFNQFYGLLVGGDFAVLGAGSTNGTAYSNDSGNMSVDNLDSGYIDFLIGSTTKFRIEAGGDVNMGSGVDLKANGAVAVDADRGFHFQSVSDTDIADATAAVNTQNKAAGKCVWDNVSGRLMVANGSGATNPWFVADGSASVTPS